MSKFYTITEVAERLRVTVKTIQKWDREGKLKALRTPSNRRIYTEESLQDFLGIPRQKRKTIAYIRVSTQAQRSDLKNQRQAVELFCQASGLANVEYVEEIGGGLNFKRKKFLDLMDQIEDNKIEKLIIAHKDRLCRFGFDYFENLCEKHQCVLLIINQESLSPQDEMVQDLMAIIHCFSSRLYGLRNYKKILKDALK